VINFDNDTLEVKMIAEDCIVGYQIPGLNILKEKYGTDKINYIAIGLDTKEDIKAFVDRKPFNFELIANGKSIYRDSFQAKWGYPFTIITDKRNKILKSFGGGKTDSTAIQNIIDKIEPIIKMEIGLYLTLDISS